MKYLWGVIGLTLFLLLADATVGEAKDYDEPDISMSTTYGDYGAQSHIIVDRKEPIYEGFDSPNDMAFLFACIALLATVGLGIVNASD
ncbi:hypothetical protein ASF99_14555 [Exiguobacterium sp. Leaf187]|uniref:Uncharacterized protein n=1 Tax=Exiguobacterium indicum TaxID=296995 RepID=A0A0V8GCX3_9BACL|nr:MULTISPECIES: hypothetical protein [Exiguobacterium]AHA28873.1 hypothetical protein U719_02920 [Exiguobacterium sp. MH3]KQS21633.1 hypothetical protein ASF99_14555 [Exiguobacterium sp. Leaf187]KSU48136.1 hypothetical protein AS033_13445 [Exiguobacterium enclense]KTR28726.1 hypothetical protein RSA11_00225 [Exiguobacterium indicum]MCQ4091892.1 hypothetical protein [Exiguobacterium sp. LL15]